MAIPQLLEVLAEEPKMGLTPEVSEKKTAITRPHAESHACPCLLEYQPTAEAAVLPYNIVRIKLVKSGIIKTFMSAALTKSCLHVMQDSFLEQIARLREGVGWLGCLLQERATAPLDTRHLAPKQKGKKGQKR